MASVTSFVWANHGHSANPFTPVLLSTLRSKLRVRPTTPHLAAV